jgi:uncharacterized protein
MNNAEMQAPSPIFSKVNKLKHSRKLTAVLNEAKRVFQLDAKRSLHGPGHWEQVERNAVELGEKTPGCDIEVARLFAILHDCKRQNEGTGEKHGARAAEFARELYDRGMLDLDPGRMAILEYALRSHNDGMVSSDPTIGVCWDADRLDLPRVGIAPVAALLSTKYAKGRIWGV